MTVITTVLYSAISSKLMVAIFMSAFESYDHNEIRLMQKCSFVGVKVSYRQHTFVYHKPQVKTCCGNEAFTSTRIFQKCGG